MSRGGTGWRPDEVRPVAFTNGDDAADYLFNVEALLLALDGRLLGLVTAGQLDESTAGSVSRVVGTIADMVSGAAMGLAEMADREAGVSHES